MKKFLILTLVLSFYSFQVMASKARMLALGQDDEVGSYILDDTRNVFYNPAYVNRYKEYMIFEWGEDASTADSDTSPKAEGGYFNGGGNFGYGVYLGGESDSAIANRDSINSTFLDQDNPAHIFVSGDMGVEWGFSLAYSQNEDEQSPSTNPIKREQSSLDLNMGFIAGNLNFFANFDIFDRSEGSTASPDEDYEADLGMKIGGAYALGDYTAYANFSKTGFEYRNGSGVIDREDEDLVYQIGFGKVQDLSDTSKLIFDISYNKSENDSEQNKSSTPTALDTSSWSFPLTIGFETEVKDWLTLRGSVKKNILGEGEDTSKRSQTTQNTTTVSMGTTLTLGAIKLDGLIGATDTSGNNGTKSGAISSNNLMTRVSLQYWF